MNRTTMLVVCALAFVLCTGSALAATETAPPADTLKVDYFANTNTSGAPDATVRITDPNTNGCNICASIFVFDVDQEMAECCSCLQTPNGLQTFSVNANLTNKPLRGYVLNGGLIKIVSTTTIGGICPLPVKFGASGSGVGDAHPEQPTTASLRRLRKTPLSARLKSPDWKTSAARSTPTAATLVFATVVRASNSQDPLVSSPAIGASCPFLPLAALLPRAACSSALNFGAFMMAEQLTDNRQGPAAAD